VTVAINPGSTKLPERCSLFVQMKPQGILASFAAARLVSQGWCFESDLLMQGFCHDRSRMLFGTLVGLDRSVGQHQLAAFAVSHQRLDGIQHDRGSNFRAAQFAGAIEISEGNMYGVAHNA